MMARPVLVIMAPAGLTLLAAPTRTASQCLFPALLGLPLVPRGVIEVIRFHRALQPALGFVGHGRIAQPPTPPIAGPAMDPQLPRNASRRTRQAQQEGGQNPVRTWPPALVEQGMGQIIEGPLAAVAPVALAPRAVVVRAPGIDVLALAPRTLEWALFPPEHMDVGLAVSDVEEVVDVREHGHG